MKDKIVGRQEEQKLFLKLLQSRRAEFVAIYGRRRVGKTYLVRRIFEGKPCLYFQVTGLKDGNMKDQLYEFTRAVERAFYTKGTILKEPTKWMQAFEILTTAIAQHKSKEKIVLFFDELPWLATKRSKLMQALDYYWNTHWVDNSRIILIVCGSAASWIIENILNNKGGLHNRITAKLRLEPFTLGEVRDLLNYNNIKLNEQQILKLYMVMGGIPYYWTYIEKGLSAAQNIDKLCFTKNGHLFTEFSHLLSSLFNESELYHDLIRRIAKYRYGIDRKVLLKQAKRSSGGRFNKRLHELEEAGFIVSFMPHKHKKRGNYYRLIDEYTLFYLDWIEPAINSIRRKEQASGYWDEKSKSAAWKSWAGYAFEAVCYKHVNSIQKVLRISPGAEIGTWRHVSKIQSDESGAQIDLLFDRDDGCITICEIKYSESPFLIDKAVAATLLKKVDIYRKQTKTNKQIFIAMVAANGLKPTMYSEELITGCVTLKELFEQ